MKKLFNQSGIIHTLPLLVIIAAVGIISFLLISSTAPIGGLFGILNPKTQSRAATSGCQFLSSPGATAAFCDDLSGGAKPGGRAGDLDHSKWSIGRFSGDNNNNSTLFRFPSTPVSSCKTEITSVNSDNDILVCDSASGHLGQMLVALNAQNYGLLSLRPRQPFDFSGRTGTITFNVDAITEGSLAWWPSLFVTDEPFSGASDSNQVLGLIPKNGVGVNFDGDNCGTSNDASQMKIIQLFQFNNFVETKLPITNGICVQTKRGFQNHIEIRLSQTNMEVWASDFSTDNSTTFPNFRKIASAPLNLNFSQGYVHYQTAERAPHKYTTQFNISPTYANYYWSNLGFDGPVLPKDTGYEVPDALTANPSGGLNVGYALLNNPYSTFTCCSQTTIGPFKIPNVNLQGVTSAKLTFTIHPTYSSPTFSTTTIAPHYRLNGGTWKDPNPAPNYTALTVCSGCPGAPVGGSGIPFSFPVALSDLTAGTNTLEFSTDGTFNSYPPVLANIDLLTFGGNLSSPTPSLSPSPSSCPKGPLGDINCDGKIDIFDYNILVGNFGKTGIGIQGDLDNNGAVNIFDYNILIGNFGK